PLAGPDPAEGLRFKRPGLIVVSAPGDLPAPGLTVWSSDHDQILGIGTTDSNGSVALPIIDDGDVSVIAGGYVSSWLGIRHDESEIHIPNAGLFLGVPWHIDVHLTIPSSLSGKLL